MGSPDRHVCDAVDASVDESLANAAQLGEPDGHWTAYGDDHRGAGDILRYQRTYTLM